jgi:hypothetical protein
MEGLVYGLYWLLCLNHVILLMAIECGLCSLIFVEQLLYFFLIRTNTARIPRGSGTIRWAGRSSFSLRSWTHRQRWIEAKRWSRQSASVPRVPSPTFTQVTPKSCCIVLHNICPLPSQGLYTVHSWDECCISCWQQLILSDVSPMYPEFTQLTLLLSNYWNMTLAGYWHFLQINEIGYTAIWGWPD